MAVNPVVVKNTYIDFFLKCPMFFCGMIKCAAKNSDDIVSSLRRETDHIVCVCAVLRNQQCVSLTKIWTCVMCNKARPSDQAATEIEGP